MHNRYSWAAAFALAVIVAGCNQAPPPPAPDTHDADVKAIRDVETAWNQSFASKDLDKMVSFFSGDASILYSHLPVITGVSAIKDAYKPYFADKNFSLSWVPDKAEVAKSGDLGYTQGAYTMTVTDPKTKKVLTAKGKYVTIYRKQADGSWKVAADISNENAPPAPAKK